MKQLFLLALISVQVIACSSSPSPVLPVVQLEKVTNNIPVKLEWTRKLDQGAGFNYLKLMPVIQGDKVYSADHLGNVQLFNLKSRSKIWETSLNTTVSSALSLSNGQIYVGSSQGEIIALSAENGKVLWRTKLSGEVLVPSPAADGVVVVRTNDGKVQGLNASDGSRRWVYLEDVPLLSLRGNSSPVISNGIVVVGTDNGKLLALTLGEGTLLWETVIAVPQGRSELGRIIDIDAEPVIIDGVIYTVSYQGRIAAVQLSSGQIHWAKEMSSYSGLTVDSSRVYLTDAESTVWALNRFNGATLWKNEKLLRRSLTRPVLQKGYIVVADYNGYVHWLSPEDGSFEARGRVNEGHYLFTEPDPELDEIFDRSENVLAAPVVEDNLLYVVDRKGMMSLFSLPG